MKLSTWAAIVSGILALIFIGGLWLWSWLLNILPDNHWAEFPLTATAVIFQVGFAGGILFLCVGAECHREEKEKEKKP